MLIKHDFAAWMLLLTTVLHSGCVHLNNYSKFDQKLSSGVEQTAVKVHVDDSAELDIRLLLLSSSSSNAPPYSFAVCAPEASVECAELVLESCVMRYADGSSRELLTAPVNIPIRQESGKEIHWFKDVIERTEDFSVRVRGFWVLQDGSRVTYDQRFEFNHQRVRGVVPAVVVWNGV